MRVFQNQNGSLQQMSSAAGTDATALHGRWNGIAAGDLDGDGDPDFVVTNFGLNTKYQPRPNRPVRLYYGDFDASGNSHIIETKTAADGALLPVRDKSASQQAMPSLSSKFPTFGSFASATVEAIYSPEMLGQARRFEMQTIESGVLWNESEPGGNVRFTFEPLPRLAQIAPGFGAQIVDTNLDGLLDIYLVDNFWSPERETGRMDGGVSLLLLGRGTGKFEPV